VMRVRGDIQRQHSTIRLPDASQKIQPGALGLLNRGLRGCRG